MLIYVSHIFTGLVGMPLHQLAFLSYLLQCDCILNNVSSFLVSLLLLWLWLNGGCSFFLGAEWWAQRFGNSIPFLSWVPFINGMEDVNCI